MWKHIYPKLYENYSEGVLNIFGQAIPTGTRKGPELHTWVTMADLQMKLLRKKIQKRNENRKKRRLINKQEEDDTGMC